MAIKRFTTLTTLYNILNICGESGYNKRQTNFFTIDVTGNNDLASVINGLVEVRMLVNDRNSFFHGLL